MADVVIYDAVGYTDKDGGYHTLSRGDEVPSDVPREQVKAWKDADRHPPFGAVREEGDRLTNMLRSAVGAATDPAEMHRRMMDAAGADAALTDPARDPSDEVKSEQDSGVAESRRLARVAAANFEAERAAEAGSASGEQLEDMSKADLQEMADGLDVDYAQADTKAELVEKIRAAQSAGA